MAALQVTVSQTPAVSKGARTKMATFRTPFRDKKNNPKKFPMRFGVFWGMAVSDLVECVEFLGSPSVSF